MSALFETGFFVRKPAWHGLGVVLDEFPGREEAMRLAGHDFEVVEIPLYWNPEAPLADPNEYALGDSPQMQEVPGWKSLGIARGGAIERTLGCVRQSYEPVQNEVCWDLVDAVIDQENINYETGATLDGGALCFVTAWLDEPRTVTGDDSPIYPYAAVNWRHDGMGSIRVIGTSVREVCANTVAAAELEASQTGREFTFRHTKNVMSYIEDAKLAIRGVSLAHSEFIELAEELGKIKLTEAQRDMFIGEFIPIPPHGVISDRVMKNVDDARALVRGLFDGETIPEAHRLTGYGAMSVAVEYLDHLRGYRSSNTYVGRTLLRPEPLKAKIIPLIHEVANA